MDELPLYESRRNLLSLWQSYRVFIDRIELRSWFGKFTIPFDEIVRIRRSPPGIRQLLSKEIKDPTTWQGIKLDMSDFCEHVELARTSGLAKVFRFTPDDIDSFLIAVENARARHKLYRSPKNPIRESEKTLQQRLR